MLISCWSVKGGVGTSVVAASLGLLLARPPGPGSAGFGRVGPGSTGLGAASHDAGVVLVDLAGDLPSVLGLSEPSGPGIAEWLGTGPAVPADGLRRIGVEVVDRLDLIARGQGALVADDRQIGALAEQLAADGRTVVVDCGRLSPADLSGSEPACLIAGAATHSLLVMRPCYLALRRAVAAPLTPSAVVVIDEPGRALGPDDVHEILGVPIAATVPLDAAVARAVDAGLLANRLPRSLARALREAA